MKLTITYLTILTVIIFQSCSSSTKEKIKEFENAPELVLLDSYFFRRAYHGLDTLEGKEFDVFMNRNPENDGVDHTDSREYPLFKELIRANLIQEKCLNLSEIDTLPEQFEYWVSPKRKLQVEYRKLEDPKEVNTPSFELSFKEKSKVILVDTLGFGFPPDVTFFTRDLNSDGKQEIVAIFRWYIVNGDNFDMTIYELRE